MDIKRLSLWEGRNATIMSNDNFSVIIEDKGEVVLEIASLNKNGARTSPLSIPYFRGRGRDVFSDENSSWWRLREGFYGSGGAYFSFPTNEEGKITSTNSIWNVKRYGGENEHGGVWKYSTMESREIENSFSISKVDLILPLSNILYSAIEVKNNGNDDLLCNPTFNSMLSYPLVIPKSVIMCNGEDYYSCPMGIRENGKNRIIPRVGFSDLKKAPCEDGSVDVSVVPNPTGTYDYIIGKKKDDDFPFISVVNPNDEMTFFILGSRDNDEDEFSFPFLTLCENWFGRLDSPWALYDGATPQVESLSVGFSFGESSKRNFILKKGESKVTYIAMGYSSIENRKIPYLHSNNIDFKDDGIYTKKIKTNSLFSVDTTFKAIKKLSRKIFFSNSNN